MFRPELLTVAKGMGLAPLSADAGTGFSLGQPDMTTHEASSRAAGDLLFGPVLDALVEDLRTASPPFRLTERLHRAGVSARHLGLVWVRLGPGRTPVRTALLGAMVGRTLKQLLRFELRALLLCRGEFSEHASVACAVEFLNQ